MVRFLLFINLLLQISIGHSQILVDKILEESRIISLGNIATADSVYIVSSEYSSEAPSDVDLNNFNKFDNLIHSFNLNGDLVWEKKFGDPEMRDLPVDLLFDTEKNILLLTYQRPFGQSQQVEKTILKKIDHRGVLVWERIFQGEGLSIALTRDSTYLLCSIEASDKGYKDKQQLVFTKINKSGRLVWQTRKGILEQNTKYAFISGHPIATKHIAKGLDQFIFAKYGAKQDDYRTITGDNYYSFHLGYLDSMGSIRQGTKLQKLPGHTLDGWEIQADGSLLTEWFQLHYDTTNDDLILDSARYFAASFDASGKKQWETYLGTTKKSKDIFATEIAMLPKQNKIVYMSLRNYHDQYAELCFTFLDRKGKILATKKLPFPQYYFNNTKFKVLSDGSILALSEITGGNVSLKQAGIPIHMLRYNPRQLFEKKQ